jgi:hypothetical protein
MKNDSAPPPQGGTIPSVDPRIALLCLAVLALVLTGLRIPAALSDPCFSGDAAHRMNMAEVVFAHGHSDHAPVEGFKKYRDYSIDGRAYSLFVSQQ